MLEAILGGAFVLAVLWALAQTGRAIRAEEKIAIAKLEITKLTAELAEKQRPYSIHFSDEGVYTLANLLLTKMKEMNGPSN